MTCDKMSECSDMAPDGIGWKNRQADLRRIYRLWERRQIDGMYPLAMRAAFEADIRRAAEIRGVQP